MWFISLAICVCLSLVLSMVSAYLLRSSKDLIYTLIVGSLPIAFYTILALTLHPTIRGAQLFSLVGLVALVEATIGWRLSLWINPSFREMTEGLDEITDEKKNLHPLAVVIMILFYESIVWISCWISTF